ncbi:hypothetical protein C8Q78DRAFT_992915 [Trametes maxima]|nr:hypothetical protein C8Q78DRAFT_992915 [Trametes maxima]
MDKQNEARRARRDAKRAREEGGSDEGPGEEVEDGTHHLGEMSAEEFLDAIIHIEAPYLVRARVNVEAIAPKGRNSEMRKRADKVAKAIGEVLFLHWSYEKRYKHKRQVSETLTFSCAQSADREQNPKVPKGPKPRDARRMERFQCHGWLHLTVSAESDVIEVSLKHREHHKPYKDIELPEEWKTFIKDHARIMSPSQIWNHIVAKEMAGKSVLTPGTALPFRQKAVYYYWQCEGRKDWRLANTPFRSAEKWLEEKGEQHHVKRLPIEPEPGTEVLAFYLPTPPDKPMPRIRLLVDSRPPPPPKGLRVTLDAQTIASALGGKPVPPVANKLANNHSSTEPELTTPDLATPSPVQSGASNPDVHGTPKFTGGSPPRPHSGRADRADDFDLARAASPAARPSNRMDNFDLARAASPAARPSNLREPSPPPLSDSESDGSDSGAYWAQQESAGFVLDDEEWRERVMGWNEEVDKAGSEIDPGDEDDIRREVVYIEADDSNIDDTPCLPDERGPKSRNPDYQFCPAAHRLPILRLFSKHACLHPLLPERHGEFRTGNEIYRGAVEEMYRHCKANNLRESRTVETLGCSGYGAAVPRKRTTMIVEALWRQIKGTALHKYNRPPIDMTLHMIVQKALPSYRLKLAEMLHNPRDGRATSLTDSQAAFKHAWERLIDVPIKGDYITDVSRWTCDCGAQKYHTHLLCKHLIKAAGKKPLPAWWPTVERYHVPPFYLIPSRDGTVAAPPESMRDRAWIPRMLAPAAIIKRPPPARRTTDTAAATSSRPSYRDRPSKNVSDPEFIFTDSTGTDIPDLDDDGASSSHISSSPGKGPHTGPDGLLRERAGGGAGYELEDAEDLDTDEVERLIACAADILPKQAKNPNTHFVRTSIRNSLRGTIQWVCRNDHRLMPDPDSLSSDDATTFLKRALTLFRQQRELARDLSDPRYVREAKGRLRGLIRWVNAVEYEEARRTMRTTNVRRGNEPDPNMLVGYMYSEK